MGGGGLKAPRGCVLGVPVVALLSGDSVHCQRKECDTAGRGVLGGSWALPNRGQARTSQGSLPVQCGDLAFPSEEGQLGLEILGAQSTDPPPPPFPTLIPHPPLSPLPSRSYWQTWLRCGSHPWDNGRGGAGVDVGTVATPPPPSHPPLPPSPPPPCAHQLPGFLSRRQALERRGPETEPPSSAHSGCPRGQGPTPTQLCPQAAWQGSGCFLKLFFLN